MFIKNNGVVYKPLVEENIRLTSSFRGGATELYFKILKDGVINITEGNNVVFKVDDVTMFNGYIFQKDRSKDGLIEVKAYDRLRYFKNKDTFIYSEKKASDVIKNVASRVRVPIGDIVDTKFVIPDRIEEDSTFLDIIFKALELTEENNFENYALYDDCGKLVLKNVLDMKSDIVIDKNNIGDYSYCSSINDDTYNKIKLLQKDDRKGYEKIVEEKSEDSFKKWGVLQYYEKVGTDEVNLNEKAKKLLKKHNRKRRTFSLSKVVGDLSIRSGSCVKVVLSLGDILIDEFMVVTGCTHNFATDEHFMDLKVKSLSKEGIINNE